MSHGPLPRILLAALLLGMLATPVLLKHLAARNAPARPEVDRTAALARYGFYLEEVAKATGIDFRHEAPTLDPKLDHIMALVASMGAAVSVVDFDRDGKPDLYAVNSREDSQNRPYRNQGDGTFRDVAPEMGVADVNQVGPGVSMGAVWGDYDNDGYEDLFLYKWGRPELFHDNGGRSFTRVTDQARLPRWLNANSAHRARRAHANRSRS